MPTVPDHRPPGAAAPAAVVEAADVLAEAARSELYVLAGAPAPLTAVGPRAVRMTMARGGEQVSAGSGADCLGGPLNAAAWPASEPAGRGDPPR